MHTHISALTGAYVFLMVALMGTLWRLGAAELVGKGGFLGMLGKVMFVQY